MVLWDRLGFRWKVTAVIPCLMSASGAQLGVGMQILEMGMDLRVRDRVPKQSPPLPLPQPLFLLLHQAPPLEGLG